MFTYRPRDIHQNVVLLALHDEADNRITEAVEWRTVTDEEIKKEQSKQREQFNKRRKVATRYSRGDIVLVARDLVATGESRKLEPRYKGPYIVGVAK